MHTSIQTCIHHPLNVHPSIQTHACIHSGIHQPSRIRPCRAHACIHPSIHPSRAHASIHPDTHCASIERPCREHPTPSSEYPRNVAQHTRCARKTHRVPGVHLPLFSTSYRTHSVVRENTFCRKREHILHLQLLLHLLLHPLLPSSAIPIPPLYTFTSEAQERWQRAAPPTRPSWPRASSCWRPCSQRPASP